MKVANAPVSWGVLEFGFKESPPGFAQVLDEIRDTGYQGTELGDWGYLPTDPERLSVELASRSLELLAAFVPVRLADHRAHDAGEAHALRVSGLLKAVAGPAALVILSDDNASVELRAANAGRIRPEHGLVHDQWKVFAGGAERIARSVLEATGLRAAFHHHCGGYVETPAELGTLMKLTDPDLLGLCLDTGHYRFGGGDPVEAVSRYAERIWHVHFKDCDPEVAANSRSQCWEYLESVRRGVFCELGQGEVDFPKVVDALQQKGYQGWIVVEQDVLPGMGVPRESAARNRVYLKSLGL